MQRQKTFHRSLYLPDSVTAEFPDYRAGKESNEVPGDKEKFVNLGIEVTISS